MEIRITRVRLRKYAERGVQLSIPRVYVDDLGLNMGDEMDIFRTDNGELLIRPAQDTKQDSAQEEQYA